MPSNHQPVPVLLECFHTLLLAPPPAVGDELYCRYCQAYTHVAKGGDSWSVRCTGCTFGRSYGTDEGQARRSATKHANGRHHKVLVKEGKVWRATINGDGETLATENGPGSVNEWTKKNPNHQGGLRALSNRNLH